MLALPCRAAPVRKARVAAVRYCHHVAPGALKIAARAKARAVASAMLPSVFFMVSPLGMRKAPGVGL